MTCAIKESRSSPVIRDSKVASPVVVVCFSSGRLIAPAAYQNRPRAEAVYP